MSAAKAYLNLLFSDNVVVKLLLTADAWNAGACAFYVYPSA